MGTPWLQGHIQTAAGDGQEFSFEQGPASNHVNRHNIEDKTFVNYYNYLSDIVHGMGGFQELVSQNISCDIKCYMKTLQFS